MEEWAALERDREGSVNARVDNAGDAAAATSAADAADAGTGGAAAGQDTAKKEGGENGIFDRVKSMFCDTADDPKTDPKTEKTGEGEEKGEKARSG